MYNGTIADMIKQDDANFEIKSDKFNGGRTCI
jgi:hypothetical protein